jgi:hypothetical protein
VSAGDARGLRAVPRPALLIGFVGVVPFVAGALAMVVGSPVVAINAYLQLMHYAAAALAFAGAAHWGLAVAAAARGGKVSWRWYAAGAAPALVGWLALGLVGPVLKVLVLALGYFAVFMFDLRAVSAGLAPSWHKALRKPLTLIVLGSLGVVGVAVLRAGGSGVPG